MLCPPMYLNPWAQPSEKEPNYTKLSLSQSPSVSTSGKCKGPDITSQTLQGHANVVQVDNYLDKIIFADQASIMNDDLMPERWFNVEAI